MCSCTVPHDQGNALAPMRNAVSDAWRHVLQGRAWLGLKRDLGITGTIRGDDEPTWGRRGWHPHLHNLIVTNRPLTAEELERLSEYIYERWSARVQRLGYRKPSREHGVVVTVSHADAYIVKLGLADEIASGLYKEPREGRLSPTQLLIRSEETGERRYLELYSEFRSAYHNRRKLTFSKGLRDHFLATPEQSEAEITPSGESSGDGQPLGGGQASTGGEAARKREDIEFEYVFNEHETVLWLRAVADNPYRMVELLACARRVGTSGVELYLRYLRLLVKLADRLGASPYVSVAWLRDQVRGTREPANAA